MKKLAIIAILLVSAQASASCREFLDDIKPYQLAYSRATTIFQQQAALTSIEIIQKQYPGEACKFKLDAYDGQVLADRIAAAKAIDLIKLIKRDITTHPSVKGALLINATIVNTAAFVQPFPMMQITLSDINSTVIAKHRFQPAEYLGTDVNLRRSMPPNSPEQISLKIPDPGKDAVNFELNFFYPTP